MMLFLLACDPGPATPATKPKRFDAVQAAPPKADAVDAFCDSRDTSDTARSFAWPVLDGQTPSMAGWTWVNVWATWCAPCVAEMPMLQGWKQKLEGEGVDFNLAFFSVDAKADDVVRWKSKNPSIVLGPRIADFGALGAWLGSVGLDASASIPIHLFVDQRQKIRCTRMGAISEADYPVIKQILAP